MPVGAMPGIGGYIAVAIPLLVTAVFAYFCGCFNGAVIVSKYILRDDVRSHGSGNAGLTNFHRTFGGGLTFVVILCDVLKAVIAVGVISALVSPVWSAVSAGELKFWVAEIWSVEKAVVLAKYWAALFCLLGHMFPCMFGFKGGKGILSGGTIAIMIDWRIALVVWGGFLILVLLTRYVSLGSVWAGGSFPFATMVLYPQPIIIVLGFLCGGLVVWKHRANIKRLLNGTESKFSLHKKK